MTEAANFEKFFKDVIKKAVFIFFVATVVSALFLMLATWLNQFDGFWWNISEDTAQKLSDGSATIASVSLIGAMIILLTNFRKLSGTQPADYNPNLN